MDIGIKKNGGDHLFVWNPCCFLHSDLLSRITLTHCRHPPLQVSTCFQFSLNMNIHEKAAPYRLYLLPGVRTVGQRHRTSTEHLCRNQSWKTMGEGGIHKILAPVSFSQNHHTVKLKKGRKLFIYPSILPVREIRRPGLKACPSE